MKKAKLVASIKNFVFAIVLHLVLIFIPANGGAFGFLQVLLSTSAFIYLFISFVFLIMRLITYKSEIKDTPAQSSAPLDSEPINIPPKTGIETNFLSQFGVIFPIIFICVFIFAIWLVFNLH